MTTPTRSRRRRTAALACAAVAGLVLTGCGGSTVRSGAAAVVGDTRITSEELGQLVETGLQDPGAAEQLGGDRPGYQRDVLERLINGEVVATAARRNGVEATPGQVQEQFEAIEQQVGGPEALREQAGAAGLSVEQVRDLARTQALSQGLADRLTEDVPVSDEQLQQAYEQGVDQFDQVRVAQLLLPTLAEAQALLPRATGLDDEQFAELVRTTSTDETTREEGGDLGLAPAGAFAGSELAPIGEAAFAAQVGDTFAVQTPRGGHVVRVLERQTTTPEQAEVGLRRTLLEQERAAALERVLRETAADLDISVNPRFGAWDGTQLAVVERVQEPGRVLSSPGPGAGDGGLAPEGALPPADPDQQQDPGQPQDPAQDPSR